MGKNRAKHQQKLAERARQKLTGTVEKLVTKTVNKTFAPKIAKMSLPEQVKFAEKTVRWQGMTAFRSHFLQDKNFPQDIADMLKDGKTPDQVWEYYWGCPEFVTFWKSLEMDEYHLRELIYGNAELQPAQ